LGALTTSHKKENETVVEFNEKFNSLVKSLHQDVKPPDATILIYYIEDFEGRGKMRGQCCKVVSMEGMDDDLS
jgi:hypothetical protein